MDFILSLQTPTPTPTPPPPPGISISTPISTMESSAPNLLVPKMEPMDEFLLSQCPFQEPETPFPPQTPDGSDLAQEPDVYSEFYNLSQLFRTAFRKKNNIPEHSGNDVVPEIYYHQGDFNVPSLNSPNPNPNPNPNPDFSISEPNSQPGGECDTSHSDPNSQAIVAVPPPTEDSTAVTVPRRGQSRRKELVRVADLALKEQLQFRELVRRTRMIYDSIRVLTSVEEEKRAEEEKKRLEEERRVEEEKKLAALTAAPAPSESADQALEVRTMDSLLSLLAAAQAPSKILAEPAPEAGTTTPPHGRSRASRRLRGDLRAASMMKARGLWLNRDKRIVGSIPGVCVGDLFLFRMELCVVGLHGQIQAGIDYLCASMSPNGEPIATSVIVSGGYEDDMDDGEVIIYTGHGGQEKNSSRQAFDQKLEGGNLALERSMHYGIEVRVIRGMRYEGSASSSGKVYVYDGLYRIVDCWFEVGKSGFGVYKYRLCRIYGQAKMGSAILKEAREIRRKGFDFKPMFCVSVDISNQKENVAVRLYNDIDDNQDPLCFEYLARTTFPNFVFHQSGNATGCDCVDGCADDCFCTMKNGGEFPYNQQGILVRGKPLIFECGPFCSCPPNCRNRVTQKGLKNRLEVFRSRQTGWGVRSLDLIHAGAFICEYTGVVLTREQAQILTMNGDSLIYPNRFSDRWAEWGDLSQIYSNYVRPSYPSIPPLDFSLDVSTMRNVACYISHSSAPNVLVQFVLYDHNNLMFPRLMLFAMENIPPMRELSLDYGVADEWTGKLSICN